MNAKLPDVAKNMIAKTFNHVDGRLLQRKDEDRRN